jgi:alpha-beta hydrolase superfamily lysophospholipase
VTAATGFLRGAGGRRLYWQSWAPESEPHALIVIVHGAGEHSGRYGYVADALAVAGYAVFALDHRGHGRSDGPRALIDRLDNAVSDLDQLVSDAHAQHASAPIYLLGHSMGGTIAVSYALKHQDRIAGMILTGPLAAIDAGAPLRLAGRALSAVAPRLPLIAVDPSLISRDPQVVDGYVRDPLVYHGKLPARTLAELASAIEKFPAAVPAITVPTLILYGTADQLCPPSGSEMLGERIGAQDRSVKAYDGLYHEILNEPEREEVLAEIRSWLSARVGWGAAAGSSTS